MNKNYVNIITQEEKDRIDDLCTDYDITNYIINNDGSIDVDGDVYLTNHKKYKSLPLRFGKVIGGFDCSSNILESLDGCPVYVGRYFDCSDNQLTSIGICPKEVGGSFYCEDNALMSLEGCPTSVGGDFDCSSNALTSLEGCPSSVGGDFDCSSNALTSLNHSPENVDGTFRCDDNQLPEAYVFNVIPLPRIEKRIFHKYHIDYEVWSPGFSKDSEFSEENMLLLLADIKDGLQ